MEEEILICECSSVEHQVVIMYDKEDNEAYCSIHLLKYGFFERLKRGLKYIFGYKCRYGEWDEFILSDKHIDKLEQLVKNLKENKKP